MSSIYNNKSALKKKENAYLFDDLKISNDPKAKKWYDGYFLSTGYLKCIARSGNDVPTDAKKAAKQIIDKKHIKVSKLRAIVIPRVIE